MCLLYAEISASYWLRLKGGNYFVSKYADCRQYLLSPRYYFMSLMEDIVPVLAVGTLCMFQITLDNLK